MVFDYSKVPAKVTISGLEKSALPLFKTNLTSLVDGSLIINVKTSNELVYYTQLAKTLNASISSEEIKNTDSSDSSETEDSQNDDSPQTESVVDESVEVQSDDASTIPSEDSSTSTTKRSRKKPVVEETEATE